MKAVNLPAAIWRCWTKRQRALLDNRQAGLSEQSRNSEEIKVAQERLAETEGETVRLQTEYDDAVTQTKSAQAALSKRQIEKSRTRQNSS